LRVDAYKTLGAAYLLANLLFGLAIIPLAIWLAKKFGDRMDRAAERRRVVTAYLSRAAMSNRSSSQ